MANIKHSLFPKIQCVLRKYLGIDQIIDNILAKLGIIKLALIIYDYAQDTITQLNGGKIIYLASSSDGIIKEVC